jgi:DNA-binding GntR family transcriptional regulator
MTREELFPLERESLGDVTYAALRRAALEGRLGDGPLVQSKVAAMLGTSRAPVRDALRRLEAECLLTCDSRGRYYVKRFDSQELSEVYSLRALLEPHAAAMAVERMDDADVERIRRYEQEAADAADDPNVYIELNRRFHFEIYRLSGSARLRRFIDSLWSGIPPVTPLSVPSQMERSVRQHKEIVDALARRDKEAVRKALSMHVVDAAVALFENLDMKLDPRSMLFH